MNYSQENIQEKTKRLTSEKYKKIYKRKQLAKFLVVLLCFAAIGCGASYTVCKVKKSIENVPQVTEKNLLAKGRGSKVYDANGRKIQQITSSNTANEYIAINQIPECVKNAFVANMDKRFYKHHGIDGQNIVKRIYGYIFGNDTEEQQEETITQQLLENQTIEEKRENNHIKRIEKKIKKQYRAIALENKMGKSKILECYLNTVYLGQNAWGIQAAAKRYFGKDVQDITASEAAVLAAVAKDPSVYDPMTAVDKNNEARKSVLKIMLEEGYLSEDDYEDALGDNVYQRLQSKENSEVDISEKKDSYYVDALKEQVIDDFVTKLGYSRTQAYHMLYHGGLKIYTCQDSKIQKICDQVINNDSYYPTSTKSYLSYRIVIENQGREEEYSETSLKNYIHDKTKKDISLYFEDATKAKKYVKKFKNAKLKEGGTIVAEEIELVKQPQASFVLMEQKTGKVMAIVGGRGSKIANLSLNRATELTKDPGSSFGMLSTYLPALDTAGMTLANVEDDTEKQYDSSAYMEESVDNSQQTKSRGLVTMRQSIIDSLKVPAYKTLEKVSVQTGYEYLKRLGFSTIVEQKKGEDEQVYSDLKLPLAVGELTDGVTNLELTAAYAAIAQGGTYTTPRFYTKIVDCNGNVILENKAESTKVTKSSTAWLLTDAMRDVIKTGVEKKSNLGFHHLSQAGQSGFVEKEQDYWFEGYTPYYTAGIWCGGSGNTTSSNKGYQITIWQEIMKQVHKLKGKTTGKFQKPNTIIEKKICTKCGNLAVSGLCDKAKGGSTVKTEFFQKGTEPTKSCTCHVKYTICKKSHRLAGDKCPKKDTYTQVLLQKKETGETVDRENTVDYNVPNGECYVHGNGKIKEETKINVPGK